MTGGPARGDNDGDDRNGASRSDDVHAPRLHATLAPFAADLAAAAEGADDAAEADAYAVLAALGRGDDPPRDAARRVVDRAENEEQ